MEKLGRDANLTNSDTEDNYYVMPELWGIKTVKFIESESRIVIARGWDGENRKY